MGGGAKWLVSFWCPFKTSQKGSPTKTHPGLAFAPAHAYLLIALHRVQREGDGLVAHCPIESNRIVGDSLLVLSRESPRGIGNEPRVALTGNHKGACRCIQLSKVFACFHREPCA